jgi:bifunctional non-homologous end joining protein LigD
LGSRNQAWQLPDVVRRDGPSVRLYSRNAYDWTARLAAIVTAAEQIKGQELHNRRRGGCASRRVTVSRSCREGARTAILYAFDLIEHDGEDMCNLPFLDRKAALARLPRGVQRRQFQPATST